MSAQARAHDYALAEAGQGGVIAHTATCPTVRFQAAMGVPVATLFGCEGELPDDIPRHDCLKDEE